MFEPNYRFTKYRGGLELLSESSGDALLYKVRLPCPLNPFLYIIFRDSELSAVDMLGNAETDTRVVIHRQCHVVHVEDNVEDNFDPREIVKVPSTAVYDISDSGELLFDSVTEEEFCQRRYREWVESVSDPSFYYHDPTMTRIVFRNEQTELDLLRDFCRTKQQHSIHDFQTSMIKFFVRLFDDAADSSDVAARTAAEVLKAVYLECLRRLSPRELFDTIGHVLQKSGRNDELSETHFIVCRADEVNIIYKRRPQAKCLYVVEFRSKDATVTGDQTFTVAYRNPVFRYEFLLLP